MSDGQNIHAYDDIINLPHPVSARHPQMSMHDRAAQFSPFAALSGYEDAVGEAGRLTCEQIELGEDAKARLDAQLASLAACARPWVVITFFVPDSLKEGGEYCTVTGPVKKIDSLARCIWMANGICIPIGNICRIELPEREEYPPGSEGKRR